MTDMDVLFEGGVDSAEEMPSSEAPASAEEVTTGENPYACEAEGVRAVYPGFDLTAEMAHPVLGAMLRARSSLPCASSTRPSIWTRSWRSVWPTLWRRG